LCKSCGIPASEEVTVKPITSGVAVREHEGLRALTLSPSACERWGVPVDFIEEMGKMSVSRRAVAVDRPGHVVLVVVDASRLVQARREMDISTERGSVTITVLVWESNTCTCVSWVLNTNSMEAIRVGWVQWAVGV
jgi:hypothetical protein